MRDFVQDREEIFEQRRREHFVTRLSGHVLRLHDAVILAQDGLDELRLEFRQFRFDGFLQLKSGRQQEPVADLLLLQFREGLQLD